MWFVRHVCQRVGPQNLNSLFDLGAASQQIFYLSHDWVRCNKQKMIDVKLSFHQNLNSAFDLDFASLLRERSFISHTYPPPLHWVRCNKQRVLAQDKNHYPNIFGLYQLIKLKFEKENKYLSIPMINLLRNLIRTFLSQNKIVPLISNLESKQCSSYPLQRSITSQQKTQLSAETERGSENKLALCVQDKMKIFQFEKV